MERHLYTALFDLDGTLIDTEGQYTRFWEEVGEELIPNGRAFAMKVKGRTLKSIFEDFIPDEQVRMQVQSKLDAYERQMQYPIIPGAMDFLADLRRNGVHLAVVTSSNLAKMNNVKARIPNLLSLFDRILTAEDFTASKPAPDCYLMGARAFHTPLDRCIVFEDAPNGLQAGRDAGIFTMGMATGYTPDALTDLCHHVESDFTHMDYERANQLLAEYNRHTAAG